jgi:hypothetical protein
MEKGGTAMAILKRRLRFRFRFGFGLAAGLTVLMLLAPGASAAKPRPKPKQAAHNTSAADQYKPTVVTYVTLTAVRVGRCKLAVTRRFVPKKRACKGKTVCSRTVARAELTAMRQCNRLAQSTRPATKPFTRAAAKPKPKPKSMH